MKTSELTGPALDWAVSKCEYDELAAARIQWPQYMEHYPLVSPSTNWSQGGPIIEREKIASEFREPFGWWAAWIHGGTGDEYGCTGPTPLIAAMRCYVASKLGDEVEIPKELTQ